MSYCVSNPDQLTYPVKLGDVSLQTTDKRLYKIGWGGVAEGKGRGREAAQPGSAH